MTRASVLANHIERTITGPMWHGPALAELLANIGAADAAARPIRDAHTIWELVLHITAWAEIARARVRGKRLGPAKRSDDWPTPPTPTAKHWSAAIAALRDSHAALARDTGALTEAALRAPVAKSKPRHSVATLLHGVIEHGTYHGGQIALLKRALADSAPASR